MIIPEAALAEGEVYKVALAQDDIPLQWAFQVRSPFQVLSTLPRDKGTQVPLDSVVEIGFNRDDLGDATGKFSIHPSVDGRFELHDDLLVFVPTQALQANTIYTVTLDETYSITDGSETLPKDVSFVFETKDTRQRSYREQPVRFSNDFLTHFPDDKPTLSVRAYGSKTGLSATVYAFDSANDFCSII